MKQYAWNVPEDSFESSSLSSGAKKESSSNTPKSM
jgi:hypothetical protein